MEAIKVKTKILITLVVSLTLIRCGASENETLDSYTSKLAAQVNFVQSGTIPGWSSPITVRPGTIAVNNYKVLPGAAYYRIEYATGRVQYYNAQLQLISPDGTTTPTTPVANNANNDQSPSPQTPPAPTPAVSPPLTIPQPNSQTNDQQEEPLPNEFFFKRLLKSLDEFSKTRTTIPDPFLLSKEATYSGASQTIFALAQFSRAKLEIVRAQDNFGKFSDFYLTFAGERVRLDAPVLTDGMMSQTFKSQNFWSSNPEYCTQKITWEQFTVKETKKSFLVGYITKSDSGETICNKDYATAFKTLERDQNEDAIKQEIMIIKTAASLPKDWYVAVLYFELN